MRLPIEIATMPGIVELAKLQKRVLGPYEIYFRENNGDFILRDADGMRIGTVAFKGTAKRGEAYKAEDPVGLENAHKIVKAVNAIYAERDMHTNGTKRKRNESQKLSS